METDIRGVFGSIDAKKVRSCMTLFYEVTKEQMFKDVLDRYYDGKMCRRTLQMMGDAG